MTVPQPPQPTAPLNEFLAAQKKLKKRYRSPILNVLLAVITLILAIDIGGTAYVLWESSNIEKKQDALRSLSLGSPTAEFWDSPWAKSEIQDQKVRLVASEQASKDLPGFAAYLSDKMAHLHPGSLVSIVIEDSELFIDPSYHQALYFDSNDWLTMLEATTAEGVNFAELATPNLYDYQEFWFTLYIDETTDARMSEDAFSVTINNVTHQKPKGVYKLQTATRSTRSKEYAWNM